MDVSKVHNPGSFSSHFFFFVPNCFSFSPLSSRWCVRTLLPSPMVCAEVPYAADSFVDPAM